MNRIFGIIFTFLLFFIYSTCHSQTKIPQTVDEKAKAIRDDTTTFKSFKIKYNNKIKYIEEYSDMRIFYERTVPGDSMSYETRGAFRSYKKDTLLFEAEEFVEYNRFNNENYKSRNIWPAETTKIAVNDITKLHRERDNLLTAMILAGFGSLVSAVVVSPLISIRKTGFDKERFFLVSGVSLATLPLWITIGVTFEWHKCYIKPGKKKKKLWTIEKETD